MCSPDVHKSTFMEHTGNHILIAYQFKDDEGIVAGWRLEILDENSGRISAGQTVFEQ